MADSPKPKRRQRDDPAVRRAQILDEAIRIIGERGYYGFAVQDLAQRCGLTTGGLLYHYGSKECLFLAVLSEYERRMAAALWDKFDGEVAGDFQTQPISRDLALRGFRAILEQSISQRQLMHLDVVLRAEALAPDHPGHDFFRQREDMILRNFAMMVRGQCADPWATARQIYCLMAGLSHQWLWADFAFDIFAEWDRVIALILPDGGGSDGD